MPQPTESTQIRRSSGVSPGGTCPAGRRGSRIAPAGDGSFFKGQLVQEAAIADYEEAYVPPWTEPYIIGVAGPSGSGKTSIAAKIIQEINTPWTVLLSLDNFYKPLKEEDKQRAFNNEIDFDHPDALDLDLCYKCVLSLKAGRKTQIPVYSFAHHDRTDRTTTIYGANVIVVEGIYAFLHEGLSSLMNLKIYVDTDLDICLARRLHRDILYRGRDLTGGINQWNAHVKPNAVRFLKPTMKNANLIVPRGSENTIGISMLIEHIKKQLVLKSEAHLDKLEKLTGKSEVNEQRYPNLTLLEQSNQSKGIYTILLNKKTSRDDFIFYFDRIAHTLINKALELTDFEQVEIVTPLDKIIKTVKPSNNVIAVNIIRSGDCFMHSLRKTIPEIAIGKLLIQSDSATGEPQLHTNALPHNIADSNNKVLLMDAQIITGAAVIMAIQVLIDHGVMPENITVVTYLASETGLSRVLKAFSSVRVVVGEIGRREQLAKQTWFRQRFIDSMYFGT